MRFSPTIRLTAAVAANLLAAVVAAVPAAAQPSTAPAPPQPGSATAGPSLEELNFAKPPPLPPGTPVPKDLGVPDRQYQQKTQCVASLNEGVVLPNKPWGQIQLRFDDLHKFATGKGQTVAVIDTGVNRHDFLGSRLTPGGDYVANNNGLQDCDGHGTEVAGIIAANSPPGSGIGFQGIAPDASIVSIRQSSANYTGKDPNDPNSSEEAAGNLGTLAQAVVRAANLVPHGVINMSVDNCQPAHLITPAEVALQSALRFAVEDRDVVVVASAGNLKQDAGCEQQNGPDAGKPTTIVTPPWFSDYVISVAAVDRNGDPATFSVQGPWVSVGAPGTEITSLDPGNPHGLANRVVTKSGPSDIQGTSFAAPYVSGMAALIRERYHNLNAKQVMNRIKATAMHPAANGGHDNLVGYGMINPVAALTAMIPEEIGISPDKAVKIPYKPTAPLAKDWAPMTVALIGSAGGVALVLLTLFVVHTVRRNRRDPDLPATQRTSW